MNNLLLTFTIYIYIFGIIIFTKTHKLYSKIKTRNRFSKMLIAPSLVNDSINWNYILFIFIIVF